MLGEEGLRTCADETTSEVWHVGRHSRSGKRPSNVELVAHEDVGVAASDEEQRAGGREVAKLDRQSTSYYPG